MTTAADYIGRTVDLLIMDGAVVSGDVQLQLVFAQPGGSGKIVTGIEKLVQRWLLEFYTEPGSMPYDPTRGCLFLYEARAGYFATPSDVRGAFARAATTIAENLAADILSTDPDDEILAAASLNSISMSPGRVSLSVSLTSQAGTSRKVIFPLSITV